MKKFGILLILLGLLSTACSGPPPAAEKTTAQAVTAVAPITPQPELPPPKPTATASPSPAPTQTTLLPGLAPTQSPTVPPTSTAPLPTQIPTPPPPAPVTLVPTPSAVISMDCPVLPAGSFLTIWQSNPELQSSLGCPTSYHPRVTPAAWEVQIVYQPYEHGAMIWSDHIGWYAQPVIYVLYPGSTYQRFEDTFDPAVDPGQAGEEAVNGLIEPGYGFGKVWREQPGVRESLGWATANETSGEGRFQTFTGGAMIWLSQTGQTYVFSQDRVYVFDMPFSEE